MYQARVTAVHKSLLELQLIGGVEKQLVILNGSLGLAISIALNNLWYIPVGMMLHFFLAWGTRKDPDFRRIYIRYSLLADIYDPWPRVSMKTNMRPKGFGRGLLC